MTAPIELEYFQVVGYFINVQSPDGTENTSKPDIEYVNAFITFTPRVPDGTVLNIAGLNASINNVLYAGNTSLFLAPFKGRLFNGQLSTINVKNTKGVYLLANTSQIQSQLTNYGIESLIYDVTFDQVIYNNTTHALTNFAFTAPTSAGTVIDISDPTLTRLPHAS